MEKNDFWWYSIPFCLGVASLILTLYGHHERTSKQVVEEPIKVVKAVTTEQKKTEVPVGKIKCVDRSANHDFCYEYVIYRTLGE
ncbi:MAG: hypothetical protein II453_17585 [Alphaproteobacteria bacterium]|nr:hypothetical protein [Alphaproteobacteria bacterium]